MEKTEVDLNSILDFIRISIFYLERDYREMDIVISVPRYVITALEYNLLTFSHVVNFDPKENRIFGKPIQANYNNSVVVFRDHPYLTTNNKCILQL